MLAAQADYLHLPSTPLPDDKLAAGVLELSSFTQLNLTDTEKSNRFCDSWSTASFGPRSSDMQMRDHHGRPITR